MNKAFKPYSKKRFYKKWKGVQFRRVYAYVKMSAAIATRTHQISVISSQPTSTTLDKCNKGLAVAELTLESVKELNELLKPKSILRVKASKSVCFT